MVFTRPYLYALLVTLVLLVSGYVVPTWADGGGTIVSIAYGELGQTDETKYGASPGDDWCSEFVSWVYNQAGYPFTGGEQGGWLWDSYSDILNWFDEHRTLIAHGSSDWNDSSFEPQPGDYVALGDGSPSHSGIVWYVSGTTLYTIEGNVSDQVRVKTHYNWRTKSSGWRVLYFGLREGKRVPVAIEDSWASSSGDGRPPSNAFDGNWYTSFWRNRTGQGLPQFLVGEIDSWEAGYPIDVHRIKIKFGSHYPRWYSFRFQDADTGLWYASSTYTIYSSGYYTHDFFDWPHQPYRNIAAVSVWCTQWSSDDYFSVYEMEVMD